MIIKNQTAIWVFSIVSFISLVIAVSFILGDSGKQDSEQLNHAEHHKGQSVYEDEFQKLVGNVAFDFTLQSYDGQKISLSEQKGKKVVLFFTEGVMCYPSCWNQIAAFGKDDAFKGNDIAVFSIVVDTRSDWERAIEKMPELAQATMLHDTSKKVSRQYGVLSLSSSMHKGQFPGHTYLILDKEGIVRFVFDDPQMAIRNDELKTELEKLN